MGIEIAVGERIKLRREALKMPQEALAQQVGYSSRSTIARIEQGSRGVDPSKLAAFAVALHTTTAYLLGAEDIDGLHHDLIAAYDNAQPAVQDTVRRILDI